MEDRRCSVEGCERPLVYTTKKLCKLHYRRLSYLGEPGPVETLKLQRRGICTVEGCGRWRDRKGLCQMHYGRLVKKGVIGPPDRLTNAPGVGHVDRHGYRKITVNGRSKSEHRHVMESHIGRPLLATDNVHHINGDRLDNRIENLEIWNTSQPSGQRVQDKVAWAIEILSLYSPHSLTP